MTLKKDGYARIEDIRLIIDNYIRDLHTRSITDHQVRNLLIQIKLQAINLFFLRYFLNPLLRLFTENQL